MCHTSHIEDVDALAAKLQSFRSSTTSPFHKMPGDETRQKAHDESDSESEDEDALDNIPKVEIDPSKLTPLSPEVISKQVRTQ